ncbi:MAG: SPFH domain-containing protein [Myxococcota bacterium]
MSSKQTAVIPPAGRRSPAWLVVSLAVSLFAPGCARVLQDEVGVRRKFGRVQDTALAPGLRWFNPFSSKIFKLKSRTVNIELQLGLPSKEGLTVRSEISILYRIEAASAPEIMKTTGLGYEEEVILPVFRSASADVCAQFLAKDMHSASRAKIEKSIQARMMDVLEERGFLIEAVLLKSIALPSGLSRAIEQKLEAEQVAQRMEFELQREGAEAQRKVIAAEAGRKTQVIAAEASRESQVIRAEGDKTGTVLRAEGTAEANKLIEDSVTPTILKYRAIEAYGELSRSNNSKVIITDGDSVPLVNLKP